MFKFISRVYQEFPCRNDLSKSPLQVPGSMTKHSGVLSTLNEIWKHEGLNGIYR